MPGVEGMTQRRRAGLDVRQQAWGSMRVFKVFTTEQIEATAGITRRLPHPLRPGGSLMSRRTAARKPAADPVVGVLTPPRFGLWRAVPAPAFPAAPEPLETRNPQPDPWPINENDIDLPDEAPPLPLRDPVADPLYLGHLTARQRGVGGAQSLDVLLACDGAFLDIGPFRFDCDNLQRLYALALVAHALIGHDRPPRTCADLAHGGLSEGEARP